MSTHDLKLQQSPRQREEKASVACVVSNQDRYYTRTNKAHFQNVSKHEKLLPAPSAQRIHNKKESESKTTANTVSQHLTGQQTSSKDLQIKKIILLKPDKDSSKISEDQRESVRITTVISLSCPPKRNKKDIGEDIEETRQNDTDIDTHETARKTAYQHYTELKDNFSKAETCSELFQDGDGPKAPFDEDSFSTWQSQHGYTTTKQGRDTGILHNIGLCEQTIKAHDSQRHCTQSVCMIQTEVSKGTNPKKDCREHVSTTSQNHSNLTSPGKDSGLKTSTEVFACLSLASFHTTLSESTSVPEQNLLNPSSTMLASAMVSVLASPWSGRVGRPKQGGNEVEHEPQDCRQNANQERRQQLFIASQRQQAERMLQESNDNERQLPARTSHISPEWQKENSSPNITTTVQSKRAVMKSSSTDTYRATMYNSADLHRVSTHLDSGQVPKSPHSEEYGEYRMSKTKAQNEPFKSLSSMPTTSSLLLSLRRANLRRLHAETTQMETPITTHVRSLTLPSRCIGKNAQSYSSSSTPDDQVGDTIVSYSFLDTASKTEEISDTSPFPFSSRGKRVVTRTPLFQNKTETEISKNPETFITKTVEQQFPNIKTKSSPLEILKPQPYSYSSIPLKKYSSTEGGDQVDLSIAYSTNQQNNINNNQDTSQISKTNSNMDVSQTGFNGRDLKSQSKQNIPRSNSMSTRTFTDNLNFSPRKGNFSVDGINTKNGGHIILDSENKSSPSSQSPMDLSSPLSPRRPLRDFRVPSIYSYLRESSPAVSSPSSPFTPFSHIQRAESSSSPMQGGGEILQSDRKPPPSRFSFDVSPLEPPAQSLKKGSSSSLIGPAQSLPPDFGRKSAPRLSTSPYSTLISSRHALNSTLQGLPSPPDPKPQDQFTFDDDTTTIYVYPIKNTPKGSAKYKSILKKPKEQLGSPDREQKTSTVNTTQAYSEALDNERPAQPYLSQTLPNASFVMESQSANITTHPRQQNTCLLEEHNGSMTVQLNKDNSYPKQTLSPKENAVTAEIAKDLHVHERLQEIPNSKKGLFALRSKKDSVFTSDSVADKDVVTTQYFKTKRNLPVFKTGSRIEQMLNRLKQTFSGKRSDNTVDPKIGNTVTQTSLHTETFERDKKEERRSSESQWKPSPINEKALKSLSTSALMKTENTLNTKVLPRVQDEKKHFGGQWEVNHPNTLGTTDKAPLSSSEALSPLTFRIIEKTLDLDGQSRNNGEKTHFGSQWDAQNSSLPADKASLPSSKSLSPLTFWKSEKILNLDEQSRVKGDKMRFGSQMDAPNSPLNIDKASLPSSESLSPFTFRKTENTLNVQRQKGWSDENGKQSYSSNLHWQKSHLRNRSATLPHYRSSSIGPPSPFNLFDDDPEDVQNDSVFYSPVSKKSNSLCDSDNLFQLSTAKSPVRQNLKRSQLSSSCVNLKYGLSNGRSFSVSSVVSSRPSGPGRISTSSVSDLSSLDSRFDSPFNISFSPTHGSKSVTNNQSQPGGTDLRNPDEQDNSSCFWDDADPTPPPSPPFSSSRRISQAYPVSPIRTTPDSPSPRRLLSSRSYSTSLPVCEESGSDTSEDEYYLDNGGDDDLETEL
nr:mucin-2 [Misgurnus anguillicaudatus]